MIVRNPRFFVVLLSTAKPMFEMHTKRNVTAERRV